LRQEFSSPQKCADIVLKTRCTVYCFALGHHSLIYFAKRSKTNICPLLHLPCSMVH
jgi:hypothetical protein